TNHAGSVPITSPTGYMDYYGVDDEYLIVSPEIGRQKLPYDELVGMDISFINQMQEYATEINATITLEDEVGPVFTDEKIGEAIDIGASVKLWDLHFEACVYAWGYSERHWNKNPLRLTLHKKLYIYVNGYIATTDALGDPIFELVYTGWVRVNIVIQVTFATCGNVLPLETCVWRLTDIEMYWATITEDIAGTTWYDDVADRYPSTAPYLFGDYSTRIAMIDAHPYKNQLPTPDGKVDIKDIALAAKAFGSYPGHDRWSTVADLNLDYQIDIRDIAKVAKQFGWVGILAPLP
ncbi:hypothetical protein KAU55_04885, partial [Candidatus Bathyarchaeota archaeon]|nr:hypothetical protein [Candidatus Bathyarchaeota archaeon]